MDGPDGTGTYSTKLKFKAGLHEYKFVIDGNKWRSDPGNPDVAGQFANSVLKIAAPSRRKPADGRRAIVGSSRIHRRRGLVDDDLTPLPIF